MSTPSLSFAAQITDLPGLSNAEFLQALSWDRSADPAIRTAAAAGNVSAFCKAWQASRRALDKLSGPTSSTAERALWSQQAFAEEAGLTRIIEQAGDTTVKRPSATRRPVNKPAVSWSQRVGNLVAELTTAVGSEEPRPFAVLASLELLANAGHRLTSSQFFPLWRQTLSEILMWPTVIYDDPTTPIDVQLIEHGEIPLIGGLLFHEISHATNLIKAGRKVLATELVDQTDTDGTPHAEILPRLPLWLAPLVRATLMMERFQEGQWTPDQRQLLANVIDRAVLLCRPDGRAALTNGLNLDSLPVLSAAVELLDLGLVGSTTEYLQAVQRAVAGKPPRRARPTIATMPSNQSDWAKFALLRSDWSVDADSVAMTHHLPLPQLDVTALGRALIHGDWQLKLKLGDAVVELAEEWSCVCWQSDPDADYIELQMAGPGKLRVERLVMLSRKERFLFVADSISGVPSMDGTKKSSGQTGQRIEYESRLSLCDGLVGSCDGTSREGRITGKRLKARVFPLAIPHDRVQSTPHQLTIEGQELVLKQVAEGEGLFAPLAFVWHPDRTRVDATWRMLTVAEEGKRVGPDVAVGYRLKLGAFQLLVSRSLKKTGNSRTCLGHHTRNETVIARFDENGDVHPILMVE
ncbi:hypothetical protein [Schlesneria paludicola]|uniref:hypothetical protein n=1 Tax=Schlesneria paludicola TaxID=360056 RepID=UPI00029B46A9|nr:hypothetical protein [Schlesneria paludicola]